MEAGIRIGLATGSGRARIRGRRVVRAVRERGRHSECELPHGGRGVGAELDRGPLFAELVWIELHHDRATCAAIREEEARRLEHAVTDREDVEEEDLLAVADALVSRCAR